MIGWQASEKKKTCKSCIPSMSENGVINPPDRPAMFWYCNLFFKLALSSFEKRLWL